MARRRALALLLAAPLILVGCDRGGPAGNNAAEADNRAIADLLDVADNGSAAADDAGGRPKKAAAALKAKAPASKPARSSGQAPRRAGERG